MAIKSADQITILDVTDAYSVILSNESHTFIGSTNAALAGTATTNVYAFQGDTPVSVTIGTIKDAAGITASVSNNGTTNALITFTVTNALTKGGTIDIPVTITGTDVVITKKFTYGIAFTGATGAQGATGATGKGVKSTEIKYQASSSGTTVPTGTWQNSIPSVSAGQYLWTRTVIAYTDNTTSTSYSVGMMGATGAQGATGATGKGVKSTSITYQVGTSGTTPPTGTWGTSVPSASAGQYVWTKTVITYTDDTTSTSYAVGMIGATGAKGDKGDAGKDAITISITSDKGNIFKNSDGETTLTAHVYQAGAELTASQISALGTLKWYKDGGSTAVGTGATLAVAASSVVNKAVYLVQLEG